MNKPCVGDYEFEFNSLTPYDAGLQGFDEISGQMRDNILVLVIGQLSQGVKVEKSLSRLAIFTLI